MSDGVGRYAQYKSLVSTAAALDEDLGRAQQEQQRLEAAIQRHRSKELASAREQREQDHATWVRARDRQLEEICAVASTVAAIEREQQSLDEEELRLTAELEVLHERQQQANETDAKRLYELVHTKTSLLNRELRQAQLDVAFLTQIVSTAKHKQGKKTATQDSDRDAVHAMVESIQRKREDALREATAQFHARLHSFEREKEALRKKTEELQWKKQRALQVLSQNQQQVLQGFFTTPREAIQAANPTLPSLAYNDIVDAITQPTGVVVGRLQGETSARRSDALAEAERIVANGPARVQALEESVRERQQQKALRLSVGEVGAAYDGRWSVETYRQDQYGLVYFVRALVFEWMDRAVGIANDQPEKQLLELEIKRFEASRAVREERMATQRAVDHVAVIAIEIHDEVLREIAQSIMNELQYSAVRVRGMVESEVKAALFSSTQSQSQRSTLRETLFDSAWKGRQQRIRPPCWPRLLMTPAVLATVREPSSATVAASPSPTKKRRGFFSSGQKQKVVTASPSPAVETSVRDTLADEPVAHSRIPIAEISPSERDADRELEQLVWKRMAISFTTFSSLASCAVVTCVQFASDGGLLAVGTADDEVVVYAVSDGGAVPVAIRSTPPVKKTSSAASRVTRLCFSGCARRLLVYNQQKMVTLWSLVGSATTHSSECFPVEQDKFKPTPLQFISRLQPAELLAEPPVPADVLENDAPVVAARLRAIPATAISAVNFFSATTLMGEQPYLLCGASNGDVLKALVANPNKGEVTTIIGRHCEAAFEAVLPTDTQLKPVSRTVAREFFRHAHRHAVLFVSSVPSSPSTLSTPQIVSVDQSGVVALWSYAKESFSGFGWFVPLAVFQLDLTPSWDILQIQLSSDRQTLVLMLYKAANTPSGFGGARLKFLQLDLAAKDAVVVSTSPVEVEFLGGVPPRFALCSVPRKVAAAGRTVQHGQPRAGKLCFVILLMDNALHVYSLHTGERSLAPISLATATPQQGRAKPATKELPITFTSIASARTGREPPTGSLTTLVAVAGEQHRQVRLYRFELVV